VDACSGYIWVWTVREGPDVVTRLISKFRDLLRFVIRSKVPKLIVDEQIAIPSALEVLQEADVAEIITSGDKVNDRTLLLAYPDINQPGQKFNWPEEEREYFLRANNVNHTTNLITNFSPYELVFDNITCQSRPRNNPDVMKANWRRLQALPDPLICSS